MSLTLSQRRKAAGLSQQELAGLAGCSVSMVSLLERGLQPDQSDVLERIERVLVTHGVDGAASVAAPTDRVGEAAA